MHDCKSTQVSCTTTTKPITIPQPDLPPALVEAITTAQVREWLVQALPSEPNPQSISDSYSVGAECERFSHEGVDRAVTMLKRLVQRAAQSMTLTQVRALPIQVAFSVLPCQNRAKVTILWGKAVSTAWGDQ